MCVLLITRLLRGVGRWARKPVNHTSWVAVVTPTDRPKSVRNRCLIELFCGVVCVVALPFWHFCWCRGFCHRIGSDLLLFVLESGLYRRNLDFARVLWNAVVEDNYISYHIRNVLYKCLMLSSKFIYCCYIFFYFAQKDSLGREKVGDLTQSFDKTPYTNRKFENQRTT